MADQTKRQPRTKPPEQRRDELMNAAQRLFLDLCVSATTIEQITSAAGVAKGTFYLYFASKDEIRAALGERYAREHLAAIAAALLEQPEQDWSAKLTSWTRANVAFYLDSISLHDMLFHDSRPPTREGLVDNIVIDHLAEMLGAGVQAGAWSIDDPRFMAVVLFSGIHGAIDDAVTKEETIDRDRLTKRAEEFCRRAVGLLPG
jgi:AcrR family transcriptional regulator